MMTRTPDEIMTGLIECTNHQCARCGYNNGVSTCIDSMLRDVLALIQQLQVELEDMTARYKIADDCAEKKSEMNEKLYAELATVKAERDAALADFKLYRERNIKGECGVYACDLCKRGGRYEDWDEIKCPTGCSGVSHWEWRGVQKEE